MDTIAKITPTVLAGAITLRNPEFKNRTQNNRPYCGLCFAKSGRMIYCHNGKEYVSDRNHALFLPKDATYTKSCLEAGEFLLINFHTTEGGAPKSFINIKISDVDNYIGEFRKLEKLRS